jgi:hypothetical protein
MHIRKYKKKDEIQILKLDRLVEVHPWNRRNLKNWFWKYKSLNPAGRSLVWVAENKKKIFATFSLIPIDYFINQSIIKGSCSIAMIVHPRWQNKGLIKFVADKLFSDANINLVRFVYGYPNSNAYNIHKSFFGYEDVYNQKLFFKKLNKIIKINETNFYEKKISKFDNEIDELWDRIKNQYKACVARSKNFLNWRYTLRPDSSYILFKYYYKKLIVGYSILKKYQENKKIKGHIVDIFYDRKIKNLFELMINKNCNYLFNDGCREIELWLQGDYLGIKKLKKNKFIVKSERPFIMKKLSINKNFSKYLNKKDWYFTMGDTLEIY